MRSPLASGPLPDAEARTRAATLFDRNLVIVAGAGTGKTALLVERALNLIAGAGVPVLSIAAITFTEKAAAELRHRLARGLDELRALAALGTAADAPGPGSEARRSYAWLRSTLGLPPADIGARALRALIDLDVASVSTIHAFCAEILRRYPREAGVDPSFVVDEGPGLDRVDEEEWGRFLRDELGTRAARAGVWRRALATPGALEAVRAIGSALAGFVVPAEAIAADARYVPAGTDAPFRSEVGALQAALAALLDAAQGMNAGMSAFLRSSIAFLAAFLEGGPEAMAAAEAPDAFDAYVAKAKPPSPGAKLAGADPRDVERLAKSAHDLIVRLGRVREEPIAALAEAALPFAARCRERLLEAGLVPFDGLLRLTRDLLARHVPVRRALAARYRTMLVDEFQDTDPLQYEILFLLAESEGEAASDPYAARLDPGRLFIVGDPKQSIYRFRGADIEAYRRAVDRVLACGGEALTLSASFRSPAAIVEPINRLFEKWMGPASAGEEPYEPRYDPIRSALASPEAAGPQVEIWSVAQEGGAEERRRAEAEAIAAWIAGHAAPEGTAGAGLLRRDVAILLRALTNAGLYAEALRRAGIPFVVEGGKDFYERAEVGDLITFLRAASNPNDGAATLAVLRGPLGAVPDAEMARFVASGGRLDRPGGHPPDRAAFPDLHRAIGLLERFRALVLGRAPDAIVLAALAETPLALLHASSFEGAQRVANLRKLAARACALARRGLSLEETLRALEDEFQGERAEGESPLADETVDAVRILSVHKAKGLEFPLVFLPDLGREAARERNAGPAAAWVRGGRGLLAVRLADGTSNMAWARHREATRRHEAAEEKRVFYVACTRAAERLILVNSNPARKAPWRDALAALGYRVEGGFPPAGPLAGGAVEHALVSGGARRRAAQERRESPLWAEAAARFEAASAAARASARPPIRWPAGMGDLMVAPSDEAGAAAGPAPRPRSAGRDAARLAGTAMHAALEGWDFKDQGRLRALLDEAVTRAASEEGDGRAAGPSGRQVARTAREILEGFLASPLPAFLAAAEILGREVPVLYRDPTGTTWTGACDLVYRDGDGTLVAADYKTDLVEGDPSEAVERYREQVGVYVEALRRALPGRSVRGALLFLRTGQVVPI